MRPTRIVDAKNRDAFLIDGNGTGAKRNGAPATKKSKGAVKRTRGKLAAATAVAVA